MSLGLARPFLSKYSLSDPGGDFETVQDLIGRDLRPAALATIKFSCQAPVPAILHANREARSEALIFYKASFGLNNFEPRIYVNAISDTILLHIDMTKQLYENDIPDDGYGQEIKEIFKNVLNLGLMMRSGRLSWEKDEDALQRLLSCFPNITSLLGIHHCVHGAIEHNYRLSRLLEVYRLDETDVLRRYQEKTLAKAVQKCYGNGEHPTVELVHTGAQKE